MKRKLTPLLCLALLLWPRPADALPAPHLLVPMVAGAAQLAWLLLPVVRRWARRVRGWRPLVAGALAAAGVGTAVADGAFGALLAMSVLALRWRWGAWLLFALVTADLASRSLFAPASPRPPLVDLPLAGSVAPSAGRTAALFAGMPKDALVVALGEHEDFFNCAVPGALLLRPADAPTAVDVLHQSGGRPLVVVHGARRHREALRMLPPVDRELSATQAAPHARWCYEAIAPVAIGVLRPISRMLGMADAPGADFGGAPRLTSLNQAPSVQTVAVQQITLTPTAALRPGTSPAVLVGDDPIAAAAAIRLWRAAGGQVIGTAPGQDSHVALPGWALVLALLALGLTCSLAEKHYLHRTDRRRSRLLALPAPEPMRVLPRGWNRAYAAVQRALDQPLPSLVSLPLAVAAGGLAQQGALSGPLAAMFSPLPWGGSGAMAACALVGCTAGVTWRTHTNRERVIGGGVVFVLGLLLVTGAVTANGVLVGLAVWLTPLAVRRLIYRRGWWVPLFEADHVPWTGGKARRLAPAARRGWLVPPGVVVHPHHPAVAADWVLARFGAVPLLVRSSAPDEDASTADAGKYASLPWHPPQGERALADALRQVTATCGGAALVMPLVAAQEGGVAALDPANHVALVEAARGTAAVTAGTASVSRHWFGLRSRVLQSEDGSAVASHVGEIIAGLQELGAGSAEWLLHHDRWWLVQLRDQRLPLPLPEAADGAWLALEQLAADDTLVMAEAEGLPDPAPQTTLALWSGMWTRSKALGEAVVLLGLPRWLAPKRCMYAVGGRLYGSTSATRWLAWLGRWPAATWFCSRAVGQFASAQPFANPTAELQRLAALSIALRLIRPHFAPSLPAADTRADLPSAQLAADVAAHRLASWGHRAVFDLDPATPRYGDAEGPPLAMPPVPARLDLAAAERWSDWLLDAMARQVARLAAEQHDWGQLPSRPTTRPQWDMAALEGLRGDNAARGPSAGQWVSGAGPICARASTTPRPGGVLLAPRATPAVASLIDGCAAIVSPRGSYLSHLAMVARGAGVPALFAVPELDIAALEGKLVVLEASGAVRVVAPPGRTADGLCHDVSE